MSPLNCWCFCPGENPPIDWFSARDQPFTVQCRLAQLRLRYYLRLPRIYDNNRYSPSRSGIQVRDEIDRGIPIIVQSRATHTPAHLIIYLPVYTIPEYGCCWKYKYNGYGIGENFPLSEFPISLLIPYYLLGSYVSLTVLEMTTHLIFMRL